MIDVLRATSDLPDFDRFCSVAELNGLVDSLQGDDRFQISIIDHSPKGTPVYHLRFGQGRVKALYVGYPHVKEPICGLTVFSLLTALKAADPDLVSADVEWHVVPCIDPDGAELNEAWSLKPFTFESYMKNFYVQSPRDQVDMSFPVHHKKLHWDAPSKEAKVLMKVLDEVRPDFFHSLHNAWTGGAFFHTSRDIDHSAYPLLHQFLRDVDFPLQTRPMWREVCDVYAEGVVEVWSAIRHYDHLEKSLENPQDVLQHGVSSWDYLREIKPQAVTFACELGYVRHPMDESDAETGLSKRKFKLRVDADLKYLGTVLIEEWEKVEQDVDKTSPLYRSVIGAGSLPRKETLLEGGRPLSMHPTPDVLFNPIHNATMTEGDVFQALMVEGGYWGLCQTYQFVRLLKNSPQTPAIKAAIRRLDAAYDEALREIDAVVDFSKAEMVDFNTLAKVQFGSGLVVLNAVIRELTGAGA